MLLDKQRQKNPAGPIKFNFSGSSGNRVLHLNHNDAGFES